MGVAKPVPAFDGLCEARTWVAKTCNSLRQSLRGSNGGCQTCNSFRQSLRGSNRGSQMSFNNICGAQTAVRDCLLAKQIGCFNHCGCRRAAWESLGTSLVPRPLTDFILQLWRKLGYEIKAKCISCLCSYPVICDFEGLLKGGQN